MGILDGLGTDKDIKNETDSLGSFSALSSNVYKLKIEKAFTTTSPGEAMALNLWCKTPDGSQMRELFWIRSGKAKGLKNFYMDKTGTKQYLPGFNHANAICLLTVGKELSKMTTETKKVMIYDYKEKKEIPTDVAVLTELTGKEFLAGVLNCLVDKTEKDAHTGEYVPTGETRTMNEISKVFRARDGLTVTEIRAKATEPDFLNKWKEKWVNQQWDRSTKAAGVVNGAPKAGKTISPPASAAAANAASDNDDNLFAD